MNVKRITTGNPRAVLIFAGWGIDAHPFEELSLPGYDIYVAYAFDGLLPASQNFTDYDELCIIAWSYGVAAAAEFIVANPQLPITARVAVNGVLKPVDDKVGMPETIFRGTLTNLSERSIYKFYRRMFGSQEAFAEFKKSMPERSVDDLRDELHAYECLSQGCSCSPLLFDRVYINPDDKILPFASQLRCWESNPGVRVTPSNHFPDFQKLLRISFRQKELVKSRLCHELCG